MEPDRNRRYLAIFFLLLIYMVTSLMQSIIIRSIDQPSTSSLFSSVKKYVALPKNEKSEPKLSKEKARVYHRLKGDYSPSFRSSEDSDSMSSKIYVELHSCLPRFICEVHAQGPGLGKQTDLEENILSLFKRHVVLEGPSSPVYTYQLAAHMGQLASGIIPTPCHSMYPSCPLSRQQLLDILSGIKTFRSPLL